MFINDFRCDLLLKFVVATVWRIGVSDRLFGDGVRLGVHQERMRTVLLATGELDSEDYAVLWSRFRPVEQAADAIDPMSVIISPHRLRLDGVNFIKLYLGATIACLKLDTRPTPVRWQRFVMRTGSPLLFVARKFDGSPELNFARRVATTERTKELPTLRGEEPR
jgi:hypothetical protein